MISDEDFRSVTQGSPQKGGAHTERACRAIETGRRPSCRPPYLNAIEHDHRYPHEDYLIEQMAKIVGISSDVLYFHANRHPADVKADVDEERVESAYRAFRKALGVKRAGKR
jgi:hypothetical protein